MRKDGEVHLWVRKFPAYSKPKLRSDHTMEEGLADAFYPAEDDYPGTTDYQQFLWVIYKDRTAREYSNGSWSDREPIAPETMRETLWDLYFTKPLIEEPQLMP